MLHVLSRLPDGLLRLQVNVTDSDVGYLVCAARCLGLGCECSRVRCTLWQVKQVGELKTACTSGRETSLEVQELSIRSCLCTLAACI